MKLIDELAAQNSGDVYNHIKMWIARVFWVFLVFLVLLGPFLRHSALDAESSYNFNRKSLSDCLNLWLNLPHG